jgi:HSP20 family protein
LHRFFDLLDDVASPTAERTWYPPLDLVEEKDRLVAHLELPGVDPKSVQENLQGDTLAIQGERQLEEGDSSGKYLHREQCFGTFTRSVQLPYRVQADKVKATYKNGVMSIVLPKADEYVGRQIPVELGQ